MQCDNQLTITRAGITFKVPCSKCYNCIKRRKDEVVFRVQQEAREHEYRYFVTLTYDTNTIHITKNGYMTLYPRDLTLYLKRLRKNTKAKIKYYAVGEYGTKKHRPHYHIILMSDIEITNMIRACWANADGELMGEVHIGQVSENSIAYTAGYVQKGIQNKYNWKHHRDDRVKEYCVSSKHLGAKFVTDEVKRYYRSTNKMYITKNGNDKIALPRYYRRKIWTAEEMLEQGEQINKTMEEMEQKERHYYEVIKKTNYEEYVMSQKKERYRKLIAKKLDKDIM